MFNFRKQDSNITEADAAGKALRAFKLDPMQKLTDVKARQGFDVAQAYAQLYFLNQESLKNFRQGMDGIYSEVHPLNRDVDLLLVMPPRGYLPSDHCNDFFKSFSRIAIAGQFAQIIQAQLNTARLITAAKRLTDIIEEKAKARRKTLVVSYSFGSSIVRFMLEQMTERQRLPITGWMNLSGVIFGSPLFSCSSKSRFFGGSSDEQRAFSSEQSFFTKPLGDFDFPIIHFIGLKKGTARTRAEMKRQEYIKAWGPNDGYMNFSGYQQLADPIVPLLDQTHQLDPLKFSSSILKSFSYLVSGEQSNKLTEELKNKFGLNLSFK